MAGSEGSGPTDLLSGWSCVVHQPSEDPEPSELPSTVDMAAFSSGLSVEATQGTQNQESCESDSNSDSESNNSGSELSGSCSASDSSDSESSSSSPGSSSRSSSPEFSVTSSQTNGLRLKIASVRKSYASPPTEKPSKSYEAKPSSKTTNTDTKTLPQCNLSSTSESACSQSSSDSSSDSDEHSACKSDGSDNKNSIKSVAAKKPTSNVVAKPLERKGEKKCIRKDVLAQQKITIKGKARSRRTRKMASLPLSRGSTCSSSDNESSDSDSKMLASLSLQEIRQEDLAAILPDQQECDAFGGFDCRPDKSSPQTGDGSGSDMELPQQAVNALLQRTTDSSSDSESPTPLNPHTLYANCLLQQFVAQTQLLNTPSSLPPTSSDLVTLPSPSIQTAADAQPISNSEAEIAKRKRGRPKKHSSKSKKSSNVSKADEGKPEPVKALLNLEYCGNPNVSPDSGIQNSSDHVSSPEPSPCPPNSKHKGNQENERRKNPNHEIRTTEKGSNNNSKNNENDNKMTVNTRGSHTKTLPKKSKVENQNKIKEQPKIPITSNSFDRVLYGNTDRVLYPPRRKAGRPPVTRKGPGRPPKLKPTNTFVQEVKPPDKPVENSETSKPNKEKVDVKVSKHKKIQNEKSGCDNSKSKSITQAVSLNKNDIKEVAQKKSKSVLLHEICERVSKRLELNKCSNIKTDSDKMKRKNRTKVSKVNSVVRPILTTKNKNEPTKIRYATFKNAKLMHSKHKHKKHKKCKFRILKPLTATVQDPQLDLEIEKLVTDFIKLCCISTQKSSKENVPEIFRALKKSTKKRKISEHNDRKKKKVNVTNSVDKETTPNEQRLPLKKRHYHLSASNENKIDSDNQIDQQTKQVSTKDNKHLTIINNKGNVDKLKCSTTIKNSVVNIPPKTEIVKSSEMESDETLKSVVTETLAVIGNVNVNHNSKNIGTHIDEAIEATITRYSNTTVNNNNFTVVCEKSPVKEEKTNLSITATTPKKRHWLEVKNHLVENKINEDTANKSEKSAELPKINNKSSKASLENVVLELKMKKNLTAKLTDNNVKKMSDKKDEIVAQIITRKKNRLEDLTSNLASKVNTNLAEENTTDMSQKKKKEEVTRTSVIKSPVCKKVKPAEVDKLDSITAEKPTGIFMPTVDIEINIPSTSIETNKENVLNKTVSSPKEVTATTKSCAEISDRSNTNESVIALSLESEDQLKKRIRKRRAINRTGFPTVKKKKKKCFMLEDKIVESPIPDDNKANICDRVPQEGEKYSAFLQRTEKVVVSDVLLEKLQKSVNSSVSIENEKSVIKRIDEKPLQQHDKMLYCEVQLMKQERPSSRLSIKHEKRDKSVLSEVSDIQVSKRIKIDLMCESKDCDGDLDDLSLEERLERSRARRQIKSEKHQKTESGKSLNDKFTIHKRRLRDISPASSDESKRNKKAPRWRKKYLVAGLFSDYYKEDDETVRQKRTEAAIKQTKLIYKPEEHRFGLLPPPYHCGKFLRCRKIPFQLPYDLWWQHIHNQLPGRDIVPSWNYRKIRTNVYNIKSTAVGVCESQTCNCSPSSGCGDDCINRLVYVECPATHKCQNQKIQRHEWAPGIEKFMTESKGWGIRTNLPIKAGEFILEYVGEVVSDQEFKERMATRYAHDTHHYCLHLDGGLVIDGHRMGGEGRFVNHSCQPNCEMQKWSVNGQFRMALFALRDIQPGEELTYDYNFSLFNPADGQECKCGSDNCRGVIGGKSQRIRQSTSQNSAPTQPGRVGRPRKNQAKRSSSTPKETPVATVPVPVVPLPSIKPMTNTQRSYVREHHCFLLRNLSKVRKLRDRSASTTSVTRTQAPTPTDHSSTFLNHLNAIRQPRNIKTRRLAQAEDDPELNKTAKLAAVFKDLCSIVSSAKDEKGDLLCIPFLNLPSRRKLSDYYSRISDPIDLMTIEQNIATGAYKNVESFDCDMMRLFNNAVKFFGRTSEMGIAATRLKKTYQEAKQEHIAKLEEVLGEKLPTKFISRKNKNEEEDVIRCICGMYRDEGLMIQCERCLVWQHCECIKADPNAPSYHCERCTPRPVDLEIPLDEYTEHGHRYYMTLLRDDLQLRQGDTVYVLRDIPIPGTDKKHNYKTIGEIEYTELDIFRIERLWKDSKSGQRFAYGHHYLRPHETFHEPTRKFFPNEVMRVPLYEAVPVELIIGHCWVMDLNTYCKGRPIGAPEDHIYICEYRVDKSARLFSKISKPKYPICTKSYAFERFDVRLKVSRTYTPHDLDPSFVKPRGRKIQDSHEPREITQQRVPLHVPVIRTRSEQKARLNKILLNLLSKLPTKQVLDVSYLLEGGRRRKKQT